MTTAELLQKLEFEGNENEFLAKEDTGLEMDIRTVIFPDFGINGNTGEGNFFFHMLSEPGEEEAGRIFVCRYTLCFDAKDDIILPLCAESVTENYEYPVGTLGFDLEDNAVIYTLQTPLPDDLSDDEMLKQAELSVMISLRAARDLAVKYASLANGGGV